jgi:hypothetical protein
MKIVHMGTTKLIQGKHDTVFVRRLSDITHTMNMMNISGTTIEAIELWMRGEDPRLLQDAFPLLTDEEREFLKTGITPEEWAKHLPPIKETK